MNTQNNTPAPVTICARFATLWAILKDYAAGTWDSIQNRTAKAALLWLQAAALAYVVFTYEFTIPAYK